MSTSSRPIPISSCGSQQSGDDAVDDSDMLISPSTLLARSCPESGSGGNPFLQPYQHPQLPPHAPRFGSLPEPSFLQMEGMGMPDLMLPPPAAPNETEHSYRAPNVLQFATSCPTSGRGFYRPGRQARANPWAPSPRTPDELDLSKSPALAVMSAMQHAQNNGLGLDPRGLYGEDVRQRGYPGAFFDEGYEDQLAMEHLSIREDYEDEEDEAATLAALTGNGYPDDDRADLYGRPPNMYEHPGPARRGSYDGVFQFEDQ